MPSIISSKRTNTFLREDPERLATEDMTSPDWFPEQADFDSTVNRTNKHSSVLVYLSI